MYVHLLPSSVASHKTMKPSRDVRTVHEGTTRLLLPLTITQDAASESRPLATYCMCGVLYIHAL
jgi:hypothetical protein